MDVVHQLIEARKKKNLSLEQIAKETKVPIDYLEAIENNQFDKLPKSSLTTMYLRTYAEFLDLPPDSILESFEKSDEGDSNQAKPTKASQLSHYGQKLKRLMQEKWVWIGGSIVVAVGLLGTTWMVIDSFDTKTEEAVVEPPSSPKTEEITNASTLTLPSAQDRAKLELIEPIEINHKSDRYRLTNVDKIELVVIAKSPTTIQVNQNNQVTNQSLSANEKAEFSDDQMISIQINEPSLVDISVNGITIEPSDPSKRVSYQFERQKASE